MSGVAGQDLSWFFNPWLYQPGAATYTYGFANATISGQPYLRLKVSQVQASPAPLFTMPMDVQITTTTGTVNTIVRSHSASDDFLIPVPASVTAVMIDPNDWILNYGKTSAAYTQGPPKVVATSPLPGATIPAASAPSTLTIVYSDPVTVSAANIGVTRGAINVPFTFAYDAPSSTATLSFGAPLAAGTYNVAISDAITATANSQHLDGELASNSAAALPSGDGVQNGVCAFSFTISGTPPCAADFNGSGAASVQDIFDFLAAWFSQCTATGPAPCQFGSADFNHSGTVTVQDLFDFLAAWFAGC